MNYVPHTDRQDQRSSRYGYRRLRCRHRMLGYAMAASLARPGGSELSTASCLAGSRDTRVKSVANRLFFLVLKQVKQKRVRDPVREQVRGLCNRRGGHVLSGVRSYCLYLALRYPVPRSTFHVPSPTLLAPQASFRVLCPTFRVPHSSRPYLGLRFSVCNSPILC